MTTARLASQQAFCTNVEDEVLYEEDRQKSDIKSQDFYDAEGQVRNYFYYVDLLVSFAHFLQKLHILLCPAAGPLIPGGHLTEEHCDIIEERQVPELLLQTGATEQDLPAPRLRMCSR